MGQLSIDWTARQCSTEARASLDLNTMQSQVLRCLRQSPGMTADEVEENTGLKGSSVRPRLLELEARSLIRRTTLTRSTRSGRKAQVWEAV